MPLDTSKSLAHWPRVKALFEEAQACPPAARAAFLDTACEDDALRREVERLLAFDDGAGAFFDTLGQALRGTGDGTGDGEPVALPLPETVGPWRITGEVGRGGMGHVLAAVRADGLYEQRVAVKLVRPGLGPDLVARFAAERRVLAGLEHPGIARLLDGGVAEDGRPYFAMEFVEGEPILAYADGARLGIEARLRLFLAVCETVAYAHRRLVVHRDLKPSNILVTAEGEPKLLDFGIAKLLDADAEDGLTRTGHLMMTPEYAAPEQITGGPISTATDVYALGLLLYELLSGHRPYVFADRSPASVAHAVCEQAPARPSTVVGRAEERRDVQGETRTVEPEEVARRRGTSTERLRRRLAGDLDVVCLKALRKEPERRYGSVEALAADVRRHLRGLPVAAQPDTVGYRARKFVRRHRVAVGAAVAVVVALAVGLGAALWQAGRAEAAAARAASEAERSEAVSQFLIDLFAVTDPTQPDGGAPTAEEMLRLGTERAEADLAERPDLQAMVYNVIATVYVGQARYDEAEPLMTRALALWEQTQGLDNLKAAETQNNLGALYFSTGAYDKAERLLRDALTTRQALLPATDPFIVEGKNNLGLTLMKQERLDEAAPLLEAALAGYRAVAGDSSMEVAVTLNNLGLVHNAQGEVAEAERLYAEALVRYRVLLGDDHPNVGFGLLNLGKAQARQDKLAEAMASARDADRALTASVGAAHPATQATRAFIGNLFAQQGRYAEAEPYLRDSYEVLRERYGEDYPSTQNVRQALVALYEQWDRPEEAARYRAASVPSTSG